MSDEPEEVRPPCRCGREVRKLNAASDTPKCVGCGYIEELCRCAVQYIVGESGPELFVPSAPGTIIPIKRPSDA